ncbi:MAG: sulfatase [Proteobacteria bacterium]|nr:sulfatase [Pseudomonadota bacterium]
MRTHPNIVLLCLDSARADRFSCYGYGRPTTPCLDDFARGGCRFEQAFTPGCWTVPSHASLFTGRYPVEHGAHDRMLPETAGPTLAELLQGAGYHTVSISANAYLGRGRGFGRGFAEVHGIWRQRPALRRGQVLGWAARRLGWADNGATAANKVAVRQARGSARPFFLFINYMETHSPYLRFWPAGGRFVGRRLALPQRWRMWRYHKQAREWDQLVRATPDSLHLLSDLYDEDIAYMDRRIGDLLSDLDAMRALENTLVIVTADHGEQMGEHGLVQHHLSLYDILLHVPLIVRWPNALQRGTVVSAQVQLNDIAPSIARLLGIQGMDREEERPNVLDPGSLMDRNFPAYAQYNLPNHVIERWGRRNASFDFAPFRRNLRAIRYEGYKYISGSDGSRELYDLRADPGETQNLTSERPDKVQTLDRALSQWLERHPPLGEETSVEADPEVEARLRELGYL